MLQHIVLFKTRQGLDRESFEKILSDAREKLTTIPGVSNLKAGTPAGQGEAWDICLSMDFEDEQALEKYRVHPTHKAYIADNLDPNVVERKALDYFME